MALPLPSGLTPPEIAFLCENELVTVVPRQRLESLDLLSGPTPSLQPPRTTPLPLWLALLLHRQRRANIIPPPWMSIPSLEAILKRELDNPNEFSPSIPFPSSNSSSNSNPYSDPNHKSNFSDFRPAPPFLPSHTASSPEGSLPYHWLELSELLLTHSPDSFTTSTSNAGQVRGLLRDLREVRMSKLREGMKSLEGGGVVSLRGVGALEMCAERGFVVGVVGGLRALGASREASRREAEEEGGGGARAGGSGGVSGGGVDFEDEEDEDDMEL